jgi:pimeloyl-ACP methyl ester carboxylesterase
VNGGIFITADGCRLAYDAAGDGSPVLWQHGLGADHNQPAEVFPSLPGICRITLECRGHGASELGDPGRLSIACFVMDALALLDHLEIDQAVVGGISLGAAIALRMAALYPSRISGLILGRPAWAAGHISAKIRKLVYSCGLRLRLRSPRAAAISFQRLRASCSPTGGEIASITRWNANWNSRHRLLIGCVFW